MEEKPEVGEKEGPADGWGRVFCLAVFLALEAAALTSVTVWQERSLNNFTRTVETGKRLLGQLEGECGRRRNIRQALEHWAPEEHGEHGRHRRQTMEDLFRELLGVEKHVLETACKRHPHLCQLGPRGDRGDNGDEGPAGPPGPMGDRGAAGQSGHQGQLGPPGNPGSLGEHGNRGAKGQKGSKGPQGHTGVKGDKGVKGIAGKPGPDGKAGALGVKGSRGHQGPLGEKGTGGETGLKGQRGDPGPQGQKGQRGAKGHKGDLISGGCLCVDVPTLSGNFSEKMEVSPHQTLSLGCHSNDLHATIVWRRNDRKPLTANVYASGGDVIFSDVSSPEEGVYECVATTSYGELRKSVEIKMMAPSPYDCDFESGLCQWRQAKDDRFDWTRISGPTPSGNTGPTTDHTLGTAAGSYLYIESSGQRVNGDNARLVSVPLPPLRPFCLTLWYHLYGTSIGNVNVRINKNGVTGGPLWVASGPSADRWLRASVNIPPQATPFRLVLEAVRGKSYNGDAAIDDIVVLPSACS